MSNPIESARNSLELLGATLAHNGPTLGDQRVLRTELEEGEDPTIFSREDLDRLRWATGAEMWSTPQSEAPMDVVAAAQGLLAKDSTEARSLQRHQHALVRVAASRTLEIEPAPITQKSLRRAGTVVRRSDLYQGIKNLAVESGVSVALAVDTARGCLMVSAQLMTDKDVTSEALQTKAVKKIQKNLGVTFEESGFWRGAREDQSLGSRWAEPGQRYRYR